MATSDTVVGIVGAVVLTAAMVAVFYYENATVDNAPDGAIGTGGIAFVYEYERATETVTETGQLAPGGEDRITFEVPAYAWAVNATLTWSETDDETSPAAPASSGPDQFELKVVNELDAEVGTKSDRSGKLDVIHFHAGGSSNETSKPEQLTVTVMADDEAEADSTLRNETADGGKHGLGTWNATVKLIDVGTGALAGQQDSGNAYSLEIVIEYWKPVLQQDDATNGATAAFIADLRAVRAFFSGLF